MAGQQVFSYGKVTAWFGSLCEIERLAGLPTDTGSGRQLYTNSPFSSRPFRSAPARTYGMAFLTMGHNLQRQSGD